MVDLDWPKHPTQLAREAIGRTEGVMSDSVDMVVRSLWDDDGGHAMSGILIEGRYKLEDVRQRTQTRSRVLRSILKTLREAGVALAQPVVRVSGLS